MPRPFNIRQIRQQNQVVHDEEAELTAAATAAGLSVSDYLKAETRVLEKTRELDQRRKSAAMSMISLTNTAIGSLPGLGAAAQIAAATVQGGTAEGAKTAIGKASQYALGGSRIADPAAWERLEYQMTRLQAVIGHGLSPAIAWLERQAEGVGNYFGGKGAQLSAPQIGDFASIRDRLQVEALRGLDPGSSKEKTPFRQDFDTFSGHVESALRGVGLDSSADLIRPFELITPDSEMHKERPRDEGKVISGIARLYREAFPEAARSIATPAPPASIVTPAPDPSAAPSDSAPASPPPPPPPSMPDTVEHKPYRGIMDATQGAYSV